MLKASGESGEPDKATGARPVFLPRGRSGHRTPVERQRPREPPLRRASTFPPRWDLLRAGDGQDQTKFDVWATGEACVPSIPSSHCSAYAMVPYYLSIL